jgi:hypothetical protein
LSLVGASDLQPVRLHTLSQKGSFSASGSLSVPSEYLGCHKVVVDCYTYLALLTTLVCPTSLCRLEPFTTEELYFYVYVRYESWFNQCPYPPFPFPTYYPDTGTGSEYSNRILVGPLAQPLSNQTSRLLTPLHTLSPSPTRLDVSCFDHRQRCTQT